MRKAREAGEHDYETIVRSAKEFTEESGLGLHFDEAHARATIWNSIHHPEVDVVVADDDYGNPVGGFFMSYENDWTVERLGYVTKFYVFPHARRTRIPLVLVKGIVEVAIKRGASRIFASATAAMGEEVEQSFVRLFGREGFKPLGRFVVKELINGQIRTQSPSPAPSASPAPGRPTAGE